MVKFNEATHTYFLEDKPLISVTQLLSKHNLAPNYAAVPERVLDAAAKRGTLIHAEVEEFITNGEIGFTSETSAFIALSQNNDFKNMKSETMLYNDMIAGTCDLMLESGGEKWIADIKTSYSVDKKYCSWQLSLYEYLSGEQFDKLVVFHLKDGAEIVEVERIPRKEIERLIECERNGELYTEKEKHLIIDTAFLEMVKEAEAQLAEVERQRAAVESVAKDYRQKLFELMYDQKVKRYISDNLSITLVEPSERTTLDSAKIKKELPEVFESYSKKSKVKGTVRVKYDS